MALRASYQQRFPNLNEGMAVYSSDGEKLGKITNLFDDYFLIEKGFFFPKDFTVRYEDIQNIQDDTVYLTMPKAEFSQWRDESYAGWQQTEEVNAGRLTAQPLDEYKDRYQAGSFEETKVPVTEEELQAEKISKKTGEVKIRKIVHSELRHFTVPVTREEIRVERVPVSDQERARSPEGAPFQEKTISIPVTEEEVTLSKRPVVKEEVRISKEKVTHEKPVEGTIRKEEVKIEGADEIKRKKAG